MKTELVMAITVYMPGRCLTKTGPKSTGLQVCLECSSVLSGALSLAGTPECVCAWGKLRMCVAGK